MLPKVTVASQDSDMVPCVPKAWTNSLDYMANNSRI